MINSLRNLSLVICLLAISAAAQAGAGRSVPVLFDVIGSNAGRSTSRVARTAVMNPTTTTLLGSANRVEARAFELMNEQRKASGLPQLAWDEQIVSLARLHSENMAARKFFSHKDPEGGYVDDRAAKLGIFNWMAIGENIAFMKGYDDPASTAVEKWMRSPAHKQNILNGQWRESAIGVAVASDGAVYFTQIFIAK